MRNHRIECEAVFRMVSMDKPFGIYEMLTKPLQRWFLNSSQDSAKKPSADLGRAERDRRSPGQRTHCAPREYSR